MRLIAITFALAASGCATVDDYMYGRALANNPGFAAMERDRMAHDRGQGTTSDSTDMLLHYQLLELQKLNRGCRRDPWGYWYCN